MPLKRGSSRKVISQNIRELEHSTTKAGKGRTHEQNVAIALSQARKSNREPHPGGYAARMARRG